ncbi:hypothetical protein N7495_009584 [Penicillium taxi]|uniref:uncharacterized protein n=1 Tax=Penicillium taxi TaxID=168475 RepID=UPI002545064A|nr:uncharacterized protein N7495_009584 [Penicillium taxi]KAJ5885074.1 hypothetical protein N7495_009584 [Penicillium taxi]
MYSLSACLLGLAIIACTHALSLEKRDNPAVLAMPMVHGSSRQLSKRSETASINLAHEKDDYTAYVANMTFGTPPQHFLAYVGTWGNGCWLESVNISDCDIFVDKSSCGGYGAYNVTASTTARDLDEKFVYNDTELMGKGGFVTDILTIGGITLDTMKMGIVDESTDYADNTLSLGYGNSSSISLTQALVDAGTINSPAFSLWDQTALFGGVNKAKYNGSLYTFPIVNGSDLEKAFRINLDGISINKTTSLDSKDFPLDAVFDTSVYMSYVPKSVAQAIYAQVGNTSVPDDVFGQVNFSCSAINWNTTIDFKFGELQLQFYLTDFMSGFSDSTFFDVYEPEGDCYFTILENTLLQYEGSVVLGSNFISLVYAVFDLENDEVSLAKRSWDHAPDDIVEITSAKSDTSVKNDAKKNSGACLQKGLSVSTLILSATMLILAL